MHLRYDVMTVIFKGIETVGHPLKQMKELGIIYQHATPQSICDQWWFWNCENIPDELPEYLSELDTDPINMIGYGLSEEKAIEIKKREGELIK